MRLNDELGFAELSKVIANLLKVTVCTLQSDLINKAISFTLAKFIFSLNCISKIVII